MPEPVQVRASNRAGGQWTESVSLPVHVVPTWYERTTFRVIMALLLLALFGLLMHVRMRLLRRRPTLLTEAGAPGGAMEFRQAMAKRALSYDVVASPDELIVTWALPSNVAWRWCASGAARTRASGPASPMR